MAHDLCLLILDHRGSYCTDFEEKFCSRLHVLLLASRGRHSPSFFSLSSPAPFQSSDVEGTDASIPQHPDHRRLITNQVETLQMTFFMKQILTVCTENQMFPHCGLCRVVLPEGNNGSWQRRRYDSLLKVFSLLSVIRFFKTGLGLKHLAILYKAPEEPLALIQGD